MFRSISKAWHATILVTLACAIANADSIGISDSNSIGSSDKCAPSFKNQKVQVCLSVPKIRSSSVHFNSPFVYPRRAAPVPFIFVAEDPVTDKSTIGDQVIDVFMYFVKHLVEGHPRQKNNGCRKSHDEACSTGVP